ncbi:PaaX family transcriptional regulator [Nocardioides albertanoniae]|uniref:PaaX family transcriptional regulator n=1 Tax=Nocardioides albertanoniae TaxID=1175486 RepID=A0A543A268_9ACTN|nr:PaaX family transcriptional regulator C-terminal domain-containing protein [Nocardioides albertanoniae]TQL66650.1 PaaX family transcriptional regulator [Nocardioides albertanoniae]
MVTARDELAPLSARSAILSLMLGAHPAPLTPADLARAGQLLGITPATVRVAITRAAGDGDLRRTDGGYRLGERLVRRQAHQDEAVRSADGPWDGSWEMAVVVVGGRSGPERAVLRDALTAHRLAELREGVWTRPANLRRRRFSDPVIQTFTARPDEDPVGLAASLWDLAGWARDAEHLLERLASTPEPALRLATAAAIVRHIDADPLLPAELRPADWPATALRETYRAYQRELSELAALPR